MTVTRQLLKFSRCNKQPLVQSSVGGPLH